MRTPHLRAGGRRSGAVIVAGLAVAAVSVGFAAISLPGTPGTEPRPASTTRAPDAAGSTPSDASVIEVDHGPTSDPDAVAACAGDGFVDDPAEAEVLYDVVQRGPAGTSPVLVLRNAAGDLRLCDIAGADRAAVLPVPAEGEPVGFLSSGSQAWDCDGRVLSGFRSTTWLLVGDQVIQAQQRFVVDGTPGPWFSTRAVGGIVHLQTWLGPQTQDVEIVAEQQVLDAAGEVVRQDTWPATQRLAGCPMGDGSGDDGGDVQIL
jgi:hypothetical protein